MSEQLGLFAPLAKIERTATLSPCGRYRYTLSRAWDHTKPRVLWVMLNPSTADATTDDLTITKCIGFSQRWGFGSLEVVNLFAYRETDQDALWSAINGGIDCVGPENDQHIVACAERAQTIVCAWGNTPGRNPKSEHRKLRVASLLEHRDLECIGITIDGAPKHPSRIGYNAERWGYRAAVRREASES